MHTHLAKELEQLVSTKVQGARFSYSAITEAMHFLQQREHVEEARVLEDIR
jgi:hypothetical protein